MHEKDAALLVFCLFLLFCAGFLARSIYVLWSRPKHQKSSVALLLSWVLLLCRVLIGTIIGAVVSITICGVDYLLGHQSWREFYADHGSAMFTLGWLSAFVGAMVGLLWGLNDLMASGQKK
jgi:hypothetical protein